MKIRYDELSIADLKATMDYCNECIQELTTLDSFGQLQVKDRDKVDLYCVIERGAHSELTQRLFIDQRDAYPEIKLENPLKPPVLYGQKPEI